MENAIKNDNLSYDKLSFWTNSIFLIHGYVLKEY